MKCDKKIYTIDLVIDGEYYKEIKDFPNYFISATGKIFSVKFRHFLEPYQIQSGHFLVKLRNGSTKPKNCYIHRLVAETWVENPNSYPIIHHIDGDISNNNAENLTWVSTEDHKASVPYWGKQKKTVMYQGVIYGSIKELAAAVGKCERTVYKWLDTGKVSVM